MRLHWPSTCTLEENIKNLVELFGTYVVYCFVEASSLKPAEGEENNKTTEDVDKRISSWLEDVLEPYAMYAYFVSIMKYQPSDKEVMSHRKTVGKKGYKLMRNRSYFPYIMGGGGSIKPLAQNKNEAKYAIDETRVNQMLEKINELYPHYYGQLNEARGRIRSSINQSYAHKNKRS